VGFSGLVGWWSAQAVGGNQVGGPLKRGQPQAARETELVALRT
jgi:hypothetical protein